MTFIEQTFSPTPGFGFVATPQFRTTIVTLDNGDEQRNIDWSAVKHIFTAPFLNISSADYLKLKDVFLACRGAAYGFRFRDWLDYQAKDQPFGVGNGVDVIFQLSKVSAFGAVNYTRVIKKPVTDGFSTKVDGVLAASVVDPTTGLVTFGSPPGNLLPLSWSGEFDVPVRFESDQFPFSLDNLNAHNSTGVTLVEDPTA